MKFLGFYTNYASMRGESELCACLARTQFLIPAVRVRTASIQSVELLCKSSNSGKKGGNAGKGATSSSRRMTYPYNGSNSSCRNHSYEDRSCVRARHARNYSPS